MEIFCRNHKFDKTDCNCGLTFTNTHQKKVHMWLTHSNGRYEKCELCSYVGPTRSMAAHREGHGKQSVCEVCGKAVAKTSVVTRSLTKQWSRVICIIAEWKCGLGKRAASRHGRCPRASARSPTQRRILVTRQKVPRRPQLGKLDH